MPVTLYQYKFSAQVETADLPKLEDLYRDSKAEEMLVLNSNRCCHIFWVGSNPPEASALSKLCTTLQIFPEEPDEFARLQERPAIKRFFEIALGMPSEKFELPDITTLHSEYSRQQNGAGVGNILNRLYHRGIWLHEKVRQETPFYQFAVNSAAVIHELVQKILGLQQYPSLTIIGDCRKQLHLVDELFQLGYRDMNFYGSKAEFLAEELLPVGAQVTFNEMHYSDAVISPLVLAFPSDAPQQIESALQNYFHRNPKSAMLLFDFSNRQLNFGKQFNNNNLYVYDQRDIQKVIDFHLEERKSVEAVVRSFIEREVDAFYQWFSSAERYQFMGIVGASPQMQRLFEMVSRIAQTDITVLIDGESGTGKELVARAIHQLSQRVNQPFLVVNCGAIPENLLESELFGYEKGAFTGAVSSRAGVFEAANHGTLFLDEIGEMPPQLQVKLLRVLQSGEIKRVGSTTPIYVDVRVLAATNKDLSKMVAAGQFRSDLFFRLNVIQITLPPLRERREDIALLARYFMEKFAQKLRKNVVGFAPETLEILTAYSWPGNIRELENVIERAVALAIGPRILPHDLPAVLLDAPPPVRAEKTESTPAELVSLKEMEQQYILQVMAATDWNYEKACRILGIGRTTLWRKLKEYGVVDKEKL